MNKMKNIRITSVTLVAFMTVFDTGFIGIARNEINGQ